MGVTYDKILAQAAARLGEGGSLVGSDAASVDASFTSFSGASTDNAVFPINIQRAALLLAEEKIASVIASVRDHPYRVYLRGISDPLADHAVIPVLTSTGQPVIGVPGAIYDGSDNTVLTLPPAKNPVRHIERIVSLTADGVLTQSYYYYTIDGTTIIHTRPTVKMELCKYNRTTQAAEILANGNVLFTDALEELYVCGELSYLFENSEAPDNVQQYLQYFAEGIKMLASGGILN